MMYEKEDREGNLEFGGALGPGPRETVADLLRHAREDFGQDVRSVAEILRIRPAYLEAIESGDFDQLPGTTYAVGFLRTYAEYLGLNGEDMVERFKAETQAAARRSELIFPEPVAEGRIPGGAIILVSVALLAVAYGGWFYLSQQGGSFADLIPAWPTDTETAAPAVMDSKSSESEAADSGIASSGTTDSGTADSSTGQAAAEPATEAMSKPDEDAGIVPPAAAQATTAEAESAAPVASVPESQAPAAPASQPSVTPKPEPVAKSPAQAEPVPTAVLPKPQADAAPVTPAQRPAPIPENTNAPTATVTPVESAPLAGSPASADEPTTLASLLDQTVVIPAPPSAPETVIIPDDRSPRAYGGSNEESRIVIRAVQDSWVQVRDSQDAILLTRVLRAGDTYRVPDVAGLTLLTGNAGGIELEVDGVRLPPAGPPGSVRRSINLDPAQLLSGTANR
jgi:cytoskeletal protein RodZ